jgi:F-type H+-transporting ATPase subunit alpha
LPAYRSIADLKLKYAQFEELETFARFGTRLDEGTRKTIEHGKRIRECLKQEELLQMTVPDQLIVLLALTNGLFDTIPIEKIQDAEGALMTRISDFPADLQKRLYADKPLSDEDKRVILKIADHLLMPFQNSSKSDENQNKPKSDEIQNKSKSDEIQNKSKSDEIQNKPKQDQDQVKQKPD